MTSSSSFQILRDDTQIERDMDCSKSRVSSKGKARLGSQPLSSMLATIEERLEEREEEEEEHKGRHHTNDFESDGPSRSPDRFISDAEFKRYLLHILSTSTIDKWLFEIPHSRFNARIISDESKLPMANSRFENPPARR